ncbi:MAG TPA: hypothetical protein VGF92_20310, partial [Stellaceae bacterium]
YATMMHFNLAPFSYYPQVGQFAAGVAKATPELGPAMYWYGWLSAALVVSVVITAVLALVLPESTISHTVPAASWIVSLLVVAFFLWDLRSWFIH